ncbi:MAG: RIO1 family regulatory kinase/ATPase [Armatimonadota bacterium]
MSDNGTVDAGFTRDEIEALTVKVLRPAWRMRPDVRVIRAPRGLVVVKDYYRDANAFKRGLGQYLINREYQAYRRLDNIHGVPQCYKCLDNWTLVTEFVDAPPAAAVNPERLDEHFFGRLKHLVGQLHGRGLAHADLHNLGNILIDKTDHPVIVDYTSAILTGSNPLAAVALPHLYDDDIRGIYKLKANCRRDMLTEEEKAFLHHRTLAENVFRSLRDLVRSPTKKLASMEQ